MIILLSLILSCSTHRTLTSGIVDQIEDNYASIEIHGKNQQMILLRLDKFEISSLSEGDLVTICVKKEHRKGADD